MHYPRCVVFGLGWALLGAACVSASQQGAPPPPPPVPVAQSFTYTDLMSGPYQSEVDMAAFAPPADALPSTEKFAGVLKISGTPSTKILYADMKYQTQNEIAEAKTLPADFNYAFVQNGDVLLPVLRGPILSSHPYWEFVLEPGKVWNQPGDHGYSRAAIPFALIQKNEGCTHNGVMTFLFKDTGAISQVAMQISSETCMYLKFDMWGMLHATYTPSTVAAASAVITTYQNNVAYRLPVRPISQLGSDYPGVAAANLIIGNPNANTLYGFVVNGIDYVSACKTRHGSYPYCAVLDLPSYSLAKSIEASVALMRLEELYPDTHKLAVIDYAPSACQRPEWSGVDFDNLLDMSTGNYDSPAYMIDENSAKTALQFFSPLSYTDKINFSCTAYPHQVQPGTRWVYHTSDTFLLGAVLNRYLHSLPGRTKQDIFRNIVVSDIYAPLGLSATVRTTMRTYDALAQPFFGMGLTLHHDDIARLALFLGADHGQINGQQMLDSYMLDSALQRHPSARGLQVATLPDYRYQDGFWARNVQNILGCANPTWVPYMLGFGGISVVLFPNGTVYYNFADDGLSASFDWGAVAIEARKFGDFCQ